jgi:hypothetical protein
VGEEIAELTTTDMPIREGDSLGNRQRFLACKMNHFAPRWDVQYPLRSRLTGMTEQDQPPFADM